MIYMQMLVFTALNMAVMAHASGIVQLWSLLI